MEARRFRKLGTKCLSPVQYVAGRDRNIHHGIGKARDAIHVTSQSKQGCGIADMDFISAFDWLVLSWVWKVLIKLGVESSVVSRLQKLYERSVTIVVVNNKLGRVFVDLRGSLRQGGCASMEWFAFGIDPLLRYLEKRLQGILLASLPVLGPALLGEVMPLPRLEERYRLMAYCDDVKPAITTMAEFFTVDKASSLFEKSSGCRLHRDPSSGKCKFLPLGRWRGVLEQEDIPLNYLVMSSSLEMVGVELKATWVQSRKANGDIVQKRVSNTVNAWKSGKFMDLTSRPWSINSFALSKVWFRCHTVDLRAMDISGISSRVKSWLFQDQLEKPEEMILHRPISMGGLGLHNVRMKAQASLIRTFLETAVNSNFQNNLLHTILYRVHVLGEHLLEDPPSLPSYFSVSFFSTIRNVKENTPLNISTMTTAQWYRVLVEDNITMQEKEDKTREFIPSRAELASTNTDWPNTWRRARLKGLGTQASTFLWKLLDRILPSEDGLSRILPNNTSYCKICPTAVHADLVHCFFQCISTRGWWSPVVSSQVT